MDLTAFYPAVKQRGVSFTVAFVYAIARAANAIAEFRYRIRGEEVVEHEVVHPSTTILTRGDLFSFCSIRYTPDFGGFAERAAEQIACAKEKPRVENLAADDWLYTTSIPWVSFTSMMHPLNLSPVDSVPRFAWGKYLREGDQLKMPLSVQAHHALLDGVHMGRFYRGVQDLLHHPEFLE